MTALHLELNSLPGPEVNLELRKAAYERLKVREQIGNSWTLGTETYSAYEIGPSLSGAGFTHTNGLIKRSRNRKNASLFTPIFGILGAGTGWVIGYLKHFTNYPERGGIPGLTTYGYYSTSSPEELRQDTLIGTGVGVVASVVSFYLIRQASSRYLEAAAKEYNRRLSHRLQISLMPQQGGVQIGLGMDY